MVQLYLRLNICIDNDSSMSSSNSSTCNILSSRRVLIWVGIVTSEAFSLTEMIWFRLNSSWITVDDIKSRSQEKHVKLSSKFNSLLSHEMSSLIQNSMQVSTIGTRHFMTSTRKGGRGVLKFVTCLRILLFLNNRSIVYFCGWCEQGVKKIGHFLWTS